MNPLMEPVDAPFDVDVVSVVVDQAALDAEPCVVKLAARKPVRYKPGTRQLARSVQPESVEPSWWTRPGADFAAEAERMRTTAMRVPSEDRVVGMPARGFV